MKNNKLLLTPERPVQVTLIERRDNVIVIPRHVLNINFNEKYVFVVEGDVAKKRNVRTGAEDAQSNVEIIEGLREGENLVVGGISFLKDNMKIRIVRNQDVKNTNNFSGGVKQ